MVSESKLTEGNKITFCDNLTVGTLSGLASASSSLESVEPMETLSYLDLESTRYGGQITKWTWLLWRVEKLCTNSIRTSLSERDLHVELCLLPLRFNDHSFEKRYGDNCNKALLPPIVFYATIGLLYFIFIWCFVILCRIANFNFIQVETDPHLTKSYTSASVIAFHVSCFISVLLLTPLATVYKITFLKNNPEPWSYGILLCLIMSWSVWGIIVASTFPIVEGRYRPLSELSYYTNKLWTDTFTQWIFVFPIVVIDFFLASRTSITLIFHLSAVPLLCSPFIAQAARFCFSVRIIAITSLQIVFFFVFSFLCFLGGYAKEVARRLDFLQLVRLEGEFKTLEELSMGERKNNVKNDAEELTGLLGEAKASIRIARLRKSSAYFDLSEKLLDKCRYLVSSSKDLYIARFTEGDENLQCVNNWNELYGGKLTPGTLSEHRSFNSSPTTPLEHQMASISNTQTMKNEVIPTPLLTKDVLSLPIQSEIAPYVGRSIDFDVLELSRRTENVLIEVGYNLLMPVLSELNVRADTAINLLSTLQNLYVDNAYHNQIHAAHVAHFSVVLAFRGRGALSSFTTSDYATLVVAAIGHDVGHSGLSNNFLGETKHPLALVYNDRSVLENFHCCLIFKSLSRPRCDIFQSVGVSTYMHVRQNIIDLVLATDMRYHFDRVSRYRLRMSAEDFDPLNNPVTMWATIKMCLKAADLSHGCLPWSNHLKWSRMVAEEFYSQGSLEELLGIDVSPPCDRSKHDYFPQSQKGFLNLFVKPVFEVLSEVHETTVETDCCLTNLQTNMMKWQEMADNDLNVEIPTGRLVPQIDPMELLCFDLEFLTRRVALSSRQKFQHFRNIVECKMKPQTIKNLSHKEIRAGNAGGIMKQIMFPLRRKNSIKSRGEEPLTSYIKFSPPTLPANVSYVSRTKRRIYSRRKGLTNFNLFSSRIS